MTTKKMIRGALLLSMFVAMTWQLGCRRNAQPDPMPVQQPVPDQTVSDAPAPKTYSIMLYRSQFNPNTLNIVAGSQIIFKNKDPEQHNVNIKDLNVDKMLKANQSFTYTFNKPGTYVVNNRVSNNTMKATITVR